MMLRILVVWCGVVAPMVGVYEDVGDDDCVMLRNCLDVVVDDDQHIRRVVVVVVALSVVMVVDGWC